MHSTIYTFGANVCGLRMALEVGTSIGTETVNLGGCELCAGTETRLGVGKLDAIVELRIVNMPKFVFKIPPVFLSGN